MLKFGLAVAFACLVAVCFAATAVHTTVGTGEVVQWWGPDVEAVLGRPEPSNLQEEWFLWFNEWKNAVVLPPGVRAWLPHVVQIWLRNFILGSALYHIVGGIWALYVYRWHGKHYFPDGDTPSKEAMWDQIWVSQKAMVLYVLVPSLGEYLIERGYTLSFWSITPDSEGNGAGGIGLYLFYTAVYLALVEFQIYWIHRLLHDIKPLYRWLHATHHIYNKNDTLSPYAGLAFHPIDGMLQASPYLITLYIVPCHFLTHELMLFFTAIWTTNIHDTLQGNTEPVMGAAYHSIHHITYKENYGQFFVFWDWFFGTLLVPDEAGWWEGATSTEVQQRLAGRRKYWVKGSTEKLEKHMWGTSWYGSFRGWLAAKDAGKATRAQAAEEKARNGCWPPQPSSLGTGEKSRNGCWPPSGNDSDGSDVGRSGRSSGRSSRRPSDPSVDAAAAAALAKKTE